MQQYDSLCSVNLKLLLASGNCQKHKWSVWIFFRDVNISHINHGGRVILPMICSILFSVTRPGLELETIRLPQPLYYWFQTGAYLASPPPFFLNHVPWESIESKNSNLSSCRGPPVHSHAHLLPLCLRRCSFPNCSLICVCVIFANLQSTKIHGKTNICCPSTLEKTYGSPRSRNGSLGVDHTLCFT